MQNTKTIPAEKLKNTKEDIMYLFNSNDKKEIKVNKNNNTKPIILISILVVHLIALIVIFILNGANILQYSDSTLNLFITGGIGEVFLLVRVIVKYLFKDNLTNALNIILKNNNPIKGYHRYNKNKVTNKKETPS